MEIDLKEQYKDYICRNKNGDLVIFKLSYWIPQRRGDIWIGNEWVNLGAYEVGDVIRDDNIIKQYKDLKWEDEPIKLN